MARSARVIDITQLVPFHVPGVFMRIDPSLEEEVASFPQIAERVESCVRFCYQITQREFENADVASLQKYLRAALVEFVSIEEVAEADLSSEALKIIETDDPRLHVLRLLSSSFAFFECILSSCQHEVW